MIDPKAVQQILESNIELLERKNADYSSMNILADGVDGVAVRMTDKIVRLRNLLSKPSADRNFESIGDTLADIMNYSIIAQLLESGGWGRDIENLLVISAEPDPDARAYLEGLGMPFSCSFDLQTYLWTSHWTKARRMATEALFGVYTNWVFHRSGPSSMDFIFGQWREEARTRGARVLLVGDWEGVEGLEGETLLQDWEALAVFVQEGFLGGRRNEI